MAFASTGTADLLRPTFFELVAAEALMPSLKAALAYSLWVNAQRQAWMGRALKYEHEIYAAVALFLEHQSLSGDCGSVSEAMYGLSRTPVGAAPGTRITKRQRWISILFLVAVPYMKAKLDSLFVQHGRVRTLQQTMEGTDETGESSRSPTNDLRQRLCLWLMRGFSSIYPWIHAGYEGSLLAYQVLYLVEKTQCFTPWLHILGLRIVRAPAEDQMRKKNRLRMQRWRRIQDIRGSASWSWLRVLKETLLQSGWAISDNVRTSLIMAVFAFKASTTLCVCVPQGCHKVLLLRTHFSASNSQNAIHLANRVTVEHFTSCLPQNSCELAKYFEHDLPWPLKHVGLDRRRWSGGTQQLRNVWQPARHCLSLPHHLDRCPTQMACHSHAAQSCAPYAGMCVPIQPT
ncbi:unnamed protein product [Ostreobium quekettii]|uniref:Pex N-terminal domain-containing protein n=1 Tax=Ostreobium quekettii TaxID=121088 RepID=A0A8S1INH3_9CHLO|nr:unnamed protein product [Ostreobium quekettii]|eukprot:evm.model.scf_81.8 EVM.evm.TU.scf_81.8   scf_81:79517-82279(+)